MTSALFPAFLKIMNISFVFIPTKHIQYFLTDGVCITTKCKNDDTFIQTFVFFFMILILLI